MLLKFNQNDEKLQAEILELEQENEILHFEYNEGIEKLKILKTDFQETMKISSDLENLETIVLQFISCNQLNV